MCPDMTCRLWHYCRNTCVRQHSLVIRMKFQKRTLSTISQVILKSCWTKSWDKEVISPAARQVFHYAWDLLGMQQHSRACSWVWPGPVTCDLSCPARCQIFLCIIKVYFYDLWLLATAHQWASSKNIFIDSFSEASEKGHTYWWSISEN